MNGRLQTYRKQNDEPLYINTEFNHPPTVIKQIPAPINRRLSALSSNKESFDKIDKAFRSSGSTPRKTQPHPQKGKEVETSSGLSPHIAKMYKKTSPKLS